jgi:hypothetical protein
MQIGLGLGIFKQSSISSLSTEYRAVLAEGIAQGYTLPTAAEQIKHDFLMRRFIASGKLGLDDLILEMNYGSKEFSCINWKNPSGPKATLINSPLWVSGVGFTGNGTSSYIKTGLNPNGSGNYLLNNASRFAYLKNAIANKVIDGIESNTSNTITTFLSANQKINQGALPILASVDYSGVGMKSIHRTNSTSVACYNSKTVTFTTAASTSLSGAEQIILRSSTGYAAHTISLYTMGAAQTAINDQTVDDYAAFLAL